MRHKVGRGFRWPSAGARVSNDVTSGRPSQISLPGLLLIKKLRSQRTMFAQHLAVPVPDTRIPRHRLVSCPVLYKDNLCANQGWKRLPGVAPSVSLPPSLKRPWHALGSAALLGFPKHYLQLLTVSVSQFPHLLNLPPWVAVGRTVWHTKQCWHMGIAINTSLCYI